MIEIKENNPFINEIMEDTKTYDLNDLSRDEIKELSEKEGNLLNSILKERKLVLKEFLLFDMDIKVKVKKNNDTYIIIENHEKSEKKVYKALPHNNDILKYSKEVYEDNESKEKKENTKEYLETYIKTLYKINESNINNYKTYEDNGKLNTKVKIREGHYHNMSFEKNMQSEDSYYLTITLVDDNNKKLTLLGKKIKFKNISELETELPFIRQDLIKESNKIIDKKNKNFRKKQSTNNNTNKGM